MKATIWHNPNCSTSRKALDRLHAEPGVAVSVVRYVDTGWDRAALAALIAEAELTPEQALRTRGNDAVERGLPDAGADAILDAMVANPAYVERPFVRTDKGVRLCRPIERIEEIL